LYMLRCSVLRRIIGVNLSRSNIHNFNSNLSKKAVRAFSKTPTTMVEGHGCHRVAHFHRQQLLDRKFKASSPNGRFIDGAAAINNQPLTRIEVHGKNLFYFFGDDTSNPVILFYHFGMSGAFSVHTPPHEPKPTTRLELINEEENIVAHLSAMTVQHGDLELYNNRIKTLGEDPLRDNANPDAVWAKISVSKKPIGLLLMDQSVIAGIGNIYRAEILFKSGVHPEQPGYTISKPTFDVIWQHSVELLQRGFQSGSILTVDPEEAEVLGQPWTRRYVYNHSTCGRCGTKILSWDMASRTVYCCGTCQPLRNTLSSSSAPDLDADAVTTTPRKQIKKTNKKSNSSSGKSGESGSGFLPAARLKAMAAARQAIEFVSHCAPDDVNNADTPLSKLTVAALRKRAEAAGIAETGQLKNKKKAELVALCEEFELKKAKEESNEEKEGEAEDVVVVKTPLPANNKRKKLLDSPPAAAKLSSPDAAVSNSKQPANKKVKPGTSGLVGRVATAKEAAVEKARAGENRGVEHVALHDDEEEKLLKSMSGGGGLGKKMGSKRK
jgi:formamidopyrimidine-DNA glycosylase